MNPRAELTRGDRQKREVVSRRAIEALKNWHRPIVFEFDIQTTIALIGQLQLAFRHPANVGPSRQVIEKLTRDLIAQLDPTKGDIYQFLCMGFDEKFDE
jgi:hypothetical protein